MAAYRQTCSACRGPILTATLDEQRYSQEAAIERGKAESARMLAAAERDDPERPNRDESDGWEAEALFHEERANRAARKARRAAQRILSARAEDPCRLCDGKGYVEATGTFVRGASSGSWQ